MGFFGFEYVEFTGEHTDGNLLTSNMRLSTSIKLNNAKCRGEYTDDNLLTSNVRESTSINLRNAIFLSPNEWLKDSPP